MKCSDFDCGSGECWNIPLSEYDMIQIDMEMPKIAQTALYSALRMITIIGGGAK